MDDTPAQLAREADAAIAAAPVDAGAAPDAAAPVAPVDGGAAWRMYTKPATNLLAGLALPQWGLTADEQHELSESLAMILSLHFPDGVDGKYAGYFRLIACSAFICATRAAAGGGKLPGFGPKRAAAEKSAAPAEPERDPHAPVN